MTSLPAKYPNVGNAKLPESYESAKTALARCERIDECKTWADKAAALASYAKQAGDDRLLDHATKIKSRAIERCGELLREMEAQPGGDRSLGRPSAKTGNQGGGKPPLISAAAAARSAGLSRDQAKTALRVAAFKSKEPEAYERAVEGTDTGKPATITELAERGKNPFTMLAGRNPKDCQAALRAISRCRDFAGLIVSVDVAQVKRGTTDREWKEFRSHVAIIAARIKTLEKEIE